MSRHEELERQRMMDAAYRAAWAEQDPAKRIDPETRAAMESLGITGPDCGDHKTPDQYGREIVGHKDDAAAMADFRSDLCAETDMAASADGLPDLLAEQFDLTPGQADGIAEFIAHTIKQTTKQTQSIQLSRIVGVFLAGRVGAKPAIRDKKAPKPQPKINLQAYAHALAHAAHMARLNGFPSLRSSAAVCDCSPEWMQRLATYWVETLDLPPLEGAKSPEACKAYSEDKKTNHWRKRKCKLNALQK